MVVRVYVGLERRSELRRWVRVQLSSQVNLLLVEIAELRNMSTIGQHVGPVRPTYCHRVLRVYHIVVHAFVMTRLDPD